jgi:hypothetical protein
VMESFVIVFLIAATIPAAVIVFLFWKLSTHNERRK